MKIWEDADGSSEWQRGLVWAEAVGFKVLPGECAPELRNGSRTMVRCPFDWHSIGSDRIGRGPYPDNAFYVVVDKGEIVTDRDGHPVRDERLPGRDVGPVRSSGSFVSTRPTSPS